MDVRMKSGGTGMPRDRIRRAKNLLLEAKTLTWAEVYCRTHGTTLSRLVEDFLETLPSAFVRDAATSHHPVVAELLGAANRGPMHTEWYRDFQMRKERK